MTPELRRVELEREARARAFERALSAWLLRVGRAEADLALREAGVLKQTEDLESELRDLLLRFGFRLATDAAAGAAAEVGQSGKIQPNAMYLDVLRGKPIKIVVFQQWLDGMEARAHAISEETKQAAREHVRTILEDAAREVPTPSTGEIARRIRTQFHGSTEDRSPVFSSERAALIARTELAQAQNTGRMAGFEATGVEEIEWLAVTNDRRSGERRHWEMHRQRVKRGATFETPLGRAMRYPGDPLGPIAETANCRCTVRAVLRGR